MIKEPATRNIHISQPSTGEEEWLAVKESIYSGWLTQGPKVAAFEQAFAKRHQVPYALASTSCTTALHLILAAMNIGPGDEVIVPAFTWVATANVVLYCGATPIFVDIDRHTYNMDPAAIAAKLTNKTKAIIAVHLFGLIADMDAICTAAPNIPIIEDAACAAGSRYKGKSAGSLGTAGAFSFHPRKSITTGEGGMVTTHDEALSTTINQLRNHGASISEEQRHHGAKPYLLPDFNLLGFNYRMTDLQGAIGIVQLQKLDQFIQERQQWAQYYRNQLQNITWLITPTVPEGYEHSWQAFVCQVDESLAPRKRNDIMEYLQAAGISTRPGTHAVHNLNYYRERYGFNANDFPNANAAEQCSLALPLHNKMQQDDYDYIISTLKAL